MMATTTETVESTVLVERRHEGRVVVLTLNRPQVLNAMNTEMGIRLNQVLEEVSEDARVRAVILTGAGERAFCAGGDLKQRQGMTPEQWTYQHRIFEAAHHKLRWFRKPIFAAVNGIAAGGGCEMAMSTDFILCADNARFGQPEVSRGIMPGAGGTQFLPRYMPRGRALELLMTGELIAADEAYRWGLVNRVVPLADLMGTAEELALRIAANSPAAVQQAKRATKMGLDQPIEQAIEIELECYRLMIDHPDRYEGVAAFNERREPRFQDRY
jgi:enoyl-CoA hydratase